MVHKFCISQCIVSTDVDTYKGKLCGKECTPISTNNAMQWKLVGKETVHINNYNKTMQQETVHDIERPGRVVIIHILKTISHATLDGNFRFSKPKIISINGITNTTVLSVYFASNTWNRAHNAL